MYPFKLVGPPGLEPGTKGLRTRLTFRPWASATAATDAPGCSHSAMTCVLNSAPYTRLWDLGCIGAHLFELVGTIVRDVSASFKMGWLDAHRASAPLAG